MEFGWMERELYLGIRWGLGLKEGLIWVLGCCGSLGEFEGVGEEGFWIGMEGEDLREIDEWIGGKEGSVWVGFIAFLMNMDGVY